MGELTQAVVESALNKYIDPYLEQDLVSAKAIKTITVEAGIVSVKVVLGFPAKRLPP